MSNFFRWIHHTFHTFSPISSHLRMTRLATKTSEVLSEPFKVGQWKLGRRRRGRHRGGHRHLAGEAFVVGKFGTSVGFYRFLKNITCSFKNKRHNLLLKRLCAFTSLKPLLWCFWIRHTCRTQPLRLGRNKWPSERYRCSCWSSPAWRPHVANNQKPNYQAASYVRTFKNWKKKKTSPLVFGITRTIAPSRL